MKVRSAVSCIAMGFACFGFVNASHAADTYPARPIKMLVGFAPGGLTDQLARLYAHKLGSELNQAVIVDNPPKAGGNVAVKMTTQPPAGSATHLAHRLNAQSGGAQQFALQNHAGPDCCRQG